MPKNSRQSSSSRSAPGHEAGGSGPLALVNALLAAKEKPGPAELSRLYSKLMHNNAAWLDTSVAGSVCSALDQLTERLEPHNKSRLVLSKLPSIAEIRTQLAHRSTHTKSPSPMDTRRESPKTHLPTRSNTSPTPSPRASRTAKKGRGSASPSPALLQIPEKKGASRRSPGPTEARLVRPSGKVGPAPGQPVVRDAVHRLVDAVKAMHSMHKGLREALVHDSVVAELKMDNASGFLVAAASGVKLSGAATVLTTLSPLGSAQRRTSVMYNPMLDAFPLHHTKAGWVSK